MRTHCLFVTFGLTAATTVSGAVVFSTDFNSGVPVQFSGIKTTDSVGGYDHAYPGSTFAGDMLVNRSSGIPQSKTTLTLTGLPAHTTVSLDFLLAIVDSWDGSSGGFHPDIFNVTVGGSTVFAYTFDNVGHPQSYPIAKRLFSQNVAFSSMWADSAYDMAAEPLLQNIPHTGSSLTVSFFASGAGWQGGNDEFWGIDNLQVSINAVPEPSTCLAGLSALGMLGLCARRSRK